MKLGFVGLGQMGKPIAQNLLKGGDALTVCSRSGRAFETFGDSVRKTTAPRDLAGCEMIFFCLPDGKAVEDVLSGPEGLAPALDKGQTVVDLSTIDYAAAVEIGSQFEARGIDFLDAPISGMERRAIDGTLTVMCGGAESVFCKVEPLLRRIGENILLMGPTGSGQLTKLINQLLFDINAAALAEILPMAAKLGLDPKRVGAVVNSGTGKSYASDFFIPRMLAGRFGDGYPMAKAYKDLVSGAKLGAELCIPMPVLAAATVTYQIALLSGHGEKDKGGMIHVFESLLQTRYRDQAAF